MQAEFNSILHPVEAGRFFQEFWRQTPLHIERGLDAFYDGIVSLADLDAYFQNRQLPAGALKVGNAGTPYPQDTWSRKGRFSPYSHITVVDIDALFRLFAGGGSIVINAAHKTLPKLTAYCSALERELRFQVQANIYITPPQAQALPIHTDDHDIIVMQLHGSKNWRFQPNPETTCASKQLILQSGDLLYLPKGFKHQAFTLDDYSIHVTLGFRPKSAHHLLEQLAALVAGDPAFQQDLPHGYSSDKEKAQFITAFSEHIAQLLQKTGPEILLHRVDENFVDQQLAVNEQRFADLLMLPKINTDTRIVKRKALLYRVEETSKELLIRFHGKQLSLPLWLRQNLTILLGNESFAVKDITGLITENGKIDLIKEWIKAGFLRLDKSLIHRLSK